MAGEKQEAPWPVPKFHFKVTIGDKGDIAFQEVSGLDTEMTIDYRTLNNPQFSTVKMPGIKRSSDVTLKKGVFKDDATLFNWFSEVKMNTIKRQNVTIQLLDEEHKVMFTWTLKNAFPMKVTGTDINPQNGEAVIEELVLAHERLTMQAA